MPQNPSHSENLLSCGARYLHQRLDTGLLGFSVSFPTFPTRDDGVAHVTEHLVFQGNQRYAYDITSARNVSRANFFSAATAFDSTHYVFTTPDPEDFFPLMDYLLYTVFRPTLSAEAFAREAFRVLPGPPQKFGGVVYNEMRSGMARSDRQIEALIRRHLYPEYPHSQVYSGGWPAGIRTLTLERVKAFHLEHYRPSAAYIYTSGDLPQETVQAWLEAHPLLQEAGVPIPPRQPLPKALPAPERVVLALPDTQAGSLLVWRIDFSHYAAPERLERIWQLRLLAQALFDHPQSALRKRIPGLSQESRLDEQLPQLTWVVAGDIQPEALHTHLLEAIAETPREVWQESLRNLSLCHLEVSHQPLPYSVGKTLELGESWMRGVAPDFVLQPQSHLSRLRATLAKPSWAESLRALFERPADLEMVLKASAEPLAFLQAEAQAEAALAEDDQQLQAQEAAIQNQSSPPSPAQHPLAPPRFYGPVQDYNHLEVESQLVYTTLSFATAHLSPQQLSAWAGRLLEFSARQKEARYEVIHEAGYTHLLVTSFKEQTSSSDTELARALQQGLPRPSRATRSRWLEGLREDIATNPQHYALGLALAHLHPDYARLQAIHGLAQWLWLQDPPDLEGEAAYACFNPVRITRVGPELPHPFPTQQYPEVTAPNPPSFRAVSTSDGLGHLGVAWSLQGWEGAGHLLAEVLQGEYLLPHLRDRIGVYHPRAAYDPARRLLYLSTYRDPSPQESLAILQGAAEFVAGLDAEAAKRNRRGFYNRLSPVETPRSLGLRWGRNQEAALRRELEALDVPLASAACCLESPPSVAVVGNPEHIGPVAEGLGGMGLIL